jgi:tRNA A37 threonylcarbamoyladenosine biosynthesis protein TsaE
MADINLKQGDMARIAEFMKCHKKSVEQILSGDRGVRKTEFQQAIIKAVELRSSQNTELEQFCNQIKQEITSPK